LIGPRSTVARRRKSLEPAGRERPQHAFLCLQRDTCRLED
jgi:hypothetical protein